MLGVREEKYFPSLFIWKKYFKTVQANFRRKFNFKNYPQKSQMYCCIPKFQATGSVNNLTKKTENPRSGRKVTAGCPDNMDEVRDSVGRSPKKSIQRRSQELNLSPYLLCDVVCNREGEGEVKNLQFWDRSKREKHADLRRLREVRFP